MITFSGPNGQHIGVTNLGMYSDNTPIVKHGQWADIIECDTVTVTGASLHTLTTALFMVDAVNWSGGWVKNLILPYLPGARQDRVNPTGDVLFTSASVAKMINDRHFGSVVYVDPHSHVMPSFLGAKREYPLTRIYKRLPTTYAGIISPDKGALARAGYAAEVMRLPIISGGKTRDVATGQLTGFHVDSLEAGGHYLVVDDICDGGGTFIGLAEKIAEQGATADLYVTHGIFSKGLDGLLNHFGTIFTTDSFYDETHRRVETINIVKEMENYA